MTARICVTLIPKGRLKLSDGLWTEKGMPLCRVYPTARALNQPNQTSSSTKQKYSALHIGSGTPSR